MLIEEEITDANSQCVPLTVEEAFHAAGGTGRFQYIFLLINSLIFMSTMIFLYTIPFLEQTEITCLDNDGKPFECKNSYPCKHKVKYEYNVAEGHDLVEEFDLLCKKTFLGFIGTSYFIGFLIDTFVLGGLSELLGRRKVMIGALCIASIGLGIFLMASNNYIWILILGAFVLGLGSAFNSVAFNFSYDNCNSYGIFIALNIMNVAYALMEIILALIMYIPHNWKYQIVFLLCYYLFAIVLIMLTKEGPRFYIFKRRYEEAEEAFRRIARYNGKSLSFPSRIRFIIESDTKEKKQKNILEICKFKLLRNRFGLLCPQFIACCLIYYGVSMDMPNIGGSIQFNTAIAGIFEIGGILTSMYMSNTKLFGRKWTLFSLYALTGLGSLFALIFQHFNNNTLTVLLVSVRKFGISGGYNIALLFAGELFPTEIRGSVVGALTLVGGIGSLSAPLIVQLISQAQYVFLAAALLASLLLLFVPETRGKIVLDLMVKNPNQSARDSLLSNNL